MSSKALMRMVAGVVNADRFDIHYLQLHKRLLVGRNMMCEGVHKHCEVTSSTAAVISVVPESLNSRRLKQRIRGWQFVRSCIPATTNAVQILNKTFIKCRHLSGHMLQICNWTGAAVYVLICSSACRQQVCLIHPQTPVKQEGNEQQKRS